MESIWTGSTENAYFNSELFDKNRTLSTPEYEANVKANKQSYYILAVDVARFKGCNTVICAIKVSPQIQGAATKTLVNMFTFNDMHFEQQTIALKRLYYKYKARRVVIDGNGIGGGFVDFMVLEQTDPDTGETLPGFGVVNDEKDEYRRYRTLTTEIDAMYIIKANAAINSEAHSNMQMQLNSGKLKFLIDDRIAKQKLLGTKAGQAMSPEKRAEYLHPFVETSILREEILNLREDKEGINITLTRVNRSI